MQRNNKPLIYTMMAVLALIVLVVSLEGWAAKKFKPITFDDTARKMIQKHHPRVVCIGNSVLSENIVKKIFDAGVKSVLGPAATALFINKGGMHAAWQYLVFKNQVVASGHKNIPVIFLDYEEYFIRPEAKVMNTAKSEKSIRENLIGEDPVVLSKIGEKGAYFTGGFPYLYSQRYNIKRYITAKFVHSLLDTTGLSRNFPKRRWTHDSPSSVQWLLGMVFKGSNFRTGDGVDDSMTSDRPAITGTSDEDFTAIADRSFLPDILKYSKDYTLIFVNSNSNPTMPQMKASLKTYSARMEKYITERGGYFIDMNRALELQVPNLMHDTRHFTKGHPRELNTNTLLKALKEKNLLK